MSVRPAASRAAREALMSELFGDVDALLKRVEQLPAVLDGAGQRLDVAASDMSRSCDHMTALMAGMQGAARNELTAILSRRAAEAASLAAEQAHVEIRAAMREALGSVLQELADRLMKQRERERRQELWISTVSMVFMAMCATGSTLVAARLLYSP